MASPGDLDTSFAGNGKKAINFGGTDTAQAVLVQPNGRILLAGSGGASTQFCVTRLRNNGLLDTTFGSRGKRKIDFGGEDEQAFGAALQPDGKIVVVGDSHVQQVAITRLNANGSLDTTFSADGKKLFSWGAVSRATAVIVLSNGNLLLGGFSGPEGGNIQAARLKPNGALDTTFGTAGIATVDLGGTEFGNAMARQANGRILIAGRSDVAGGVVVRLRTTGMLDPDFNGGHVSVPGAVSLDAVLVQPDRKIVVAGTTLGSEKMIVARLMPNGTPDGGFGTNGIVTIDFGSLADLVGGAVLQADAKIVVAGYSQSDEDVAVVRLNANGSPDATFGTAGRANVDFGVATFGNAVALQKNGRIVVAGQTTAGDNFAVARLRA
jgi:uncharacterized delta-60 repeat protein